MSKKSESAGGIVLESFQVFKARMFPPKLVLKNSMLYFKHSFQCIFRSFAGYYVATKHVIT